MQLHNRLRLHYVNRMAQAVRMPAGIDSCLHNPHGVVLRHPAQYGYRLLRPTALKDGIRYVGEFKNGMIDGQGVFFLKSGNKYIGELKKGKFDGQGTFYFSNGETYVGKFKNDKPIDGQGTFFLADGTPKSDSDIDWGAVIDWTLRGLSVIAAIKGHPD